ncbi:MULTISPECIES: dATP/dGTP diphosphohydrolase domain-containing protein [unclassified Pseudomonas]|uniref:dATP/dGTP diphosphohydrolase domain-containing protein n=1 Tax=unclassified Pseudomonas TaxID=196821 RepID=UPI00211456F0|nr:MULTISPECIES: dATP/dGTP diphosphohydrolase domain-containing protein [unclassified Pseudomonas]
MTTPQSSAKPSNPKDLIGAGKLPMHLWPVTATAMGCIGLLNGHEKYGNLNWRAAGVRASVYIDALQRHVAAWFEGEECDPDDGVPHLAAALSCLAILVDAQAHGQLTDDRSFSPAPGFRNLLEQLTPHVARLQLQHADRKPKHWLRADNDVQRCADDVDHLFHKHTPGDPCPADAVGRHVDVINRSGEVMQFKDPSRLNWGVRSEHLRPFEFVGWRLAYGSNEIEHGLELCRA